MTHDRVLLAALLKEESGNGRLHQPVLITWGWRSMKETLASKRSAGIWFSTLMCGAIASGTSANHHLRTSTDPSAHGDQPNVKRKELRSQPDWTRMDLDARGAEAVKTRSRFPPPTAPSASARPPIAQNSSRDRPPVHRRWRPSGQRHGRRSRRSAVP